MKINSYLGQTVYKLGDEVFSIATSINAESPEQAYIMLKHDASWNHGMNPSLEVVSYGLIGH